MAKARIAYLCSECGAHSVKWAGQCPDCGAWNTLSETSIVATPAVSGVAATRLDELPDDLGTRHATGFGEFDRVLGGGLVPGAVTLLGGDPGVGKSTLLQQVSASLARDLAVCYATGEESLRQIGQRSLRLGLAQSEMNLLADTALENVLDQARQCRAKVVVIDSIQTMTCNDLPSAPGSVAQLREGVGRLVQFAKQHEVSVFIIGHVTKEGAIAGPRVVEHMVDTVLYFESDPSSRYTMIRSVKNRFGASGEMGVFAMTEAGFREVSNPSAIFLSRESVDEPGSIVSVAWEGSRPLLVEIQALVAVVANEDVFVNVVGGLRISETAVDLPILLSIVSSFRDRAAQDRLICFGEIGLAGEIRPIKFGTERIAAAAKQGFTRAIVPQGNVPRKARGDIEVIGVRRLSDALDQAW
jgi:DNA repair protein RadA/Sms